MEINLWAALNNDGSFSFSHAIFGSGAMAWIGVPVCSYSISPAADCLIRSAISALLLSAQMMMLCKGLPFWSTAMMLCMALLMITAAGFVLASAIILATHFT